jgi:hypothetical protein
MPIPAGRGIAIDLRALSRPDKLCGGGKGREEGVCRLTFLKGEIEIEIGDWRLEFGDWVGW